MNARYRVGLDVGTASLGLVAVSLDEAGKPLDIIHSDLRIWNEPLVAKTGTLLNQDRRAKRLHRRQIRRRARRMRSIAHLAPTLGLSAESILLSNEQKKNGERILELRSKSVTERIELDDFLRVMLHLAKKRGYKGTFKTSKQTVDSKEETPEIDEAVDTLTELPSPDIEQVKETKLVKDGIGKLADVLAQRGGITVGEYLYLEHLASSARNLKFGKDHTGFYASRNMIEDEFDRIWENQRKFHSTVLDKSYPLFASPSDEGTLDLTPRPLKEHFRRAVLYQRPVVWDAGTIGRCQLENGLARASLAQPSAQFFRMEKNIADLRWHGASREERLTQKQNQAIRVLLQDPNEMDAHGIVSFKRIYEALIQQDIIGIDGNGKPQSFSKDRRAKTNSDTSSRLSGLIGDRTRKAFHRIGVLDQWDALNPNLDTPDSKVQIQVINFLSGLTSVEEIEGTDTDWASRFEPTVRMGKRKGKKRGIPADVVNFINEIHSTGKLDLLGKMGFDTARSAYCVRANRILANYMKEHETDETTAKCRVYHKCSHSSKNADCPRSVDLSESKSSSITLQRPDSTGNQVVDISLEQIYYAMTELIEKHGTPAEVHVELARDMKLSAKGRREVEYEQGKKAKNREDIFKEILNLGGAPTGKNINKYLLARDMGNRCPYCWRTLSIEDILSESATEFEHILPRGRSGVGKRNLSHSLLACRSCNSSKSDRLAWDAFPHNREELQRSAELLSPGILDRLKAESGSLVKKKTAKKSTKNQGAGARARMMENKARWLLQQSFEEVQDSESAIDSLAPSAANDTSWISKIACEWLDSVSAAPVFATRGRITALTRRRWALETVIPQTRIDAGLPVFTVKACEGISTPIELEKNVQIGILDSDKFAANKKYWEGHSPRSDLGSTIWIPPIDKRRDHRHHLIDALAIALTTRSIAQRLSVGRKRNADTFESDRQSGFDLENWQDQYAPGLPQHREKAVLMIENAFIKRKSDRHVSGQLLEETAYARRGDVIGSRSQLTTLKKESELENIIDQETREAVISQINAYVSGTITGEKLSFSQAINMPIYHRFVAGEGKGTLIKSVLMARKDLPGNSPSLLEVANKKNPERPFIYKSGGNAYIEIYDSGEAKLVTKFEASQIRKEVASEGEDSTEGAYLRRFYGNDLVRELDTEGNTVGPIYAVASMTTGPILRLVPATETCTFNQAMKIGKLNKSVSGRSLKKWIVVEP